jgi:hypothetical protein
VGKNGLAISAFRLRRKGGKVSRSPSGPPGPNLSNPPLTLDFHTLFQGWPLCSIRKRIATSRQVLFVDHIHSQSSSHSRHIRSPPPNRKAAVLSTRSFLPLTQHRPLHPHPQEPYTPTLQLRPTPRPPLAACLLILIVRDRKTKTKFHSLHTTT